MNQETGQPADEKSQREAKQPEPLPSSLPLNIEAETPNLKGGDSEDRRRHKEKSSLAMKIEAGCAIAIVVITGFYTHYAAGQRQAMIKSNEISSAAMMISQRAYAYFRPDIESHKAQSYTGEEAFILVPIMENGGNTPAFNVLHRASTNPRHLKLPDNFDYADTISKQALFKNISPERGGAVIIGPHRAISDGGIPVTEAVSKGINTGRTHVYLWGWMSYDDIFGCFHKTEFCSELIQMVPEGPLFSNCEKHNCADQDCKDYVPTKTAECSLELKNKPK